jgi:hypothetical protein
MLQFPSDEKCFWNATLVLISLDSSSLFGAWTIELGTRPCLALAFVLYGWILHWFLRLHRTGGSFHAEIVPALRLVHFFPSPSSRTLHRFFGSFPTQKMPVPFCTGPSRGFFVEHQTRIEKGFS